MADFPITREPSPRYYCEQVIKAQVQTPFDAGTVQSAAKHTRARRMFKTGWEAITETELASLESFFESSQGESFTFASVRGTTYEVRFMEDQLPEARWVGELDGQDAWEIGPIPLAEL